MKIINNFKFDFSNVQMSPRISSPSLSLSSDHISCWLICPLFHSVPNFFALSILFSLNHFLRLCHFYPFFSFFIFPLPFLSPLSLHRFSPAFHSSLSLFIFFHVYLISPLLCSLKLLHRQLQLILSSRLQ